MGFRTEPEQQQTVSRRRFLESVLVGAGGLATPALLPGAAPSERRGAASPNIMLIVAEDMGPQIGCYGDTTVPTPSLDALARHGVLFRNAYVTQASCSPSRSSILNGLYPHQTFQLGLAHCGYRTHLGMPNLPGLLKARGYRTGAVGKIHVSPEKQFPFDVRGKHPHKDMRGYAAWARTFIKETADRPFFAYVNFSDCHKPFKTQEKGIPAEPVPVDKVRPFPVHAGMEDEAALLKETAGYYHGVQRVDAGVGMLIDVLEETGHDRGTLVVFIGDHGPPLSRGKTTTYEFGIRIPFLLRWPGRATPGRQTEALISTVDILPTCVAAAGGDLPSPLAGLPLQPLLEGDEAGWRDTLCAEWHTHGPGFAPQRCIRDRRYKLILNLRTDTPKPGKGVDGCVVSKLIGGAKYDGTDVRRVFDLMQKPPKVELYDLQADPREYRNLAGRPEMREVEQRLLGQLEAWRRETRDPFLDQEFFKRVKQHYQRYRADLPALRKKLKKKRVPIDMRPFQRPWAEVLKRDYAPSGQE